MQSINERFMNKFIELEKICNDIFGCQSGVTEYINQLEVRSDCKMKNSPWYNFYLKLCVCREKRNAWVHLNDYADISETDIEFLDKLYQDILNRRDPLCKLPELHTVSFYVDKKLFKKVSFKEGDRRISEPAVPKKEGYVGKWSSYTLGNKDIFIDANYTPIIHKASFYAGNKLIATVNFKEGDRRISEPAVPKIAGYEGRWEDYTLGNKDIVVKAIYNQCISKCETPIQTFKSQTLFDDPKGPIDLIITNKYVNYDWNSNVFSEGGGPVGTNRKNGFMAYDVKGDFIGLVYMCDDHRWKSSYGNSEIMFAKKHQNSYGRWRIIKIKKQYLPFDKLSEILSTHNECNVMVDGSRGKR